MADEVLQLVALIISDVDGLVSLLVYYLLLVDCVAVIHHSIRRHHASPPDLSYSTGVAIPLVVLAMSHGSRRHNGLSCIVGTSTLCPVIVHGVEI